MSQFSPPPKSMILLHSAKTLCIPTVMALVISGLSVASSLRAEAPDASSVEPAKNVAATTSKDELTVTHHRITICDQELEYTATAGTLVMHAEDAANKPTANIFFIAYTKDGIKNLGKRPISFCFNGGPGSSSIWLHLGMLGPRRVPIHDDAQPLAPPYKLVPNSESLLDQTDLVFIDPVSTGYSRPAAGEDKKQFHGFDEDIESVGQFIHLYTTRYNRWQSPRFLIGESYGTLRAAGLSAHLFDRYNMTLNGIVLVSSILDFATIVFNQNNDLPYVLFLPTYTATAWYHKRLPPDLQENLEKTLTEVKEFAIGEYNNALFKGDDLPAAERRAIIDKLVRYTGLSPEFLDRNEIRVDNYRFAKNILQDERKLVGRFDSRFVGVDSNPGENRAGYDPSSAAIFPPYTATLYHYLHNELNIKRDVPYEVISDKVRPWNYRRFTNNYANAIGALNDAMTKNTHLKVFVASGYFDLATPFLGSEYTFNHLGLGPELRKNITIAYYDAGHMMYVHGPSLQKLKADLVRFYQSATSH